MGRLRINLRGALTPLGLQEPLTLGSHLQPCRSPEVSEFGGFSPTEASCRPCRPRRLAAANGLPSLQMSAASLICWHFSAFARYRSDRDNIKPSRFISGMRKNDLQSAKVWPTSGRKQRRLG